MVPPVEIKSTLFMVTQLLCGAKLQKNLHMCKKNRNFAADFIIYAQ
jgi:hypothetical protein